MSTKISVMTVAVVLAGCVGASRLEAGFLTPGSWTPGDTGSTYQQWDIFTAGADNTPDVVRLTDGAALADPTAGVASPGFVTSTGNFYSFSGAYSVAADISNYGGGAGTHVIVQMSASVGR